MGDRTTPRETRSNRKGVRGTQRELLVASKYKLKGSDEDERKDMYLMRGPARLDLARVDLAQVGDEGLALAVEPVLRVAHCDCVQERPVSGEAARQVMVGGASMPSSQQAHPR